MEGGLFLSHNPFKKWWKKQVKTADFSVDNSALCHPEESKDLPVTPPSVIPAQAGILRSPGTTLENTAGPEDDNGIARDDNNKRADSPASSAFMIVKFAKALIILQKRFIRHLRHEEKIIEREIYQGEEDIKKEIIAIERISARTTKTLFPFFARPHRYLCTKYLWYYNWHLSPHTVKIHYTAFSIALLSAFSLVYSTYLPLSHAGITQTAIINEPKLAVTEVTIDKNPDKFYLQDETTKEYTKAYTVEETADGTKIKTKSATDAGFQQLLVNGNDSTLYDGDKLVAQAQVKTEEKDKDGNWIPIAIKSETLNPKSETNSKDSNSNDKTTPVSFINKVTAEDSQTITKELKYTTITDKTPDKVTVDNTATLSNGEELKVAVEAGLADYSSSEVEKFSTPDGESNDKTPIQKQTFSLDNKDQTTKRLSWVVQLKDFDITEDQKFEIPSTKSETNSNIQNSNDQNNETIQQSNNESRVHSYASTVIDCSDYTGPMTWVENKDTDTVTIYFDEAGTTDSISSSTRP